MVGHFKNPSVPCCTAGCQKKSSRSCSCLSRRVLHHRLDNFGVHLRAVRNVDT